MVQGKRVEGLRGLSPFWMQVPVDFGGICWALTRKNRSTPGFAAGLSTASWKTCGGILMASGPSAMTLSISEYPNFPSIRCKRREEFWPGTRMPFEG
jgi:hypothetical protein